MRSSGELRWQGGALQRLAHRVSQQHELDPGGWPCCRALLAMLLARLLRGLVAVEDAGVCLAGPRCAQGGGAHVQRGHTCRLAHADKPTCRLSMRSMLWWWMVHSAAGWHLYRVPAVIWCLPRVRGQRHRCPVEACTTNLSCCWSTPWLTACRSLPLWDGLSRLKAAPAAALPAPQWVALGLLALVPQQQQTDEGTPGPMMQPEQSDYRGTGRTVRQAGGLAAKGGHNS